MLFSKALSMLELSIFTFYELLSGRLFFFFLFFSLFGHTLRQSHVVSSKAYTAEAREKKSNRYHLYLNKKNIKNIKI